VSETRVIHVRDMKDHPNAVYIGRAMPRQGLKASPFANPYRIDKSRSREAALEAYARYLAEERQDLVARLPELRGKPLACWCRRAGEPIAFRDEGPDNRCHGDILVNIVSAYTDEQLRALGKDAEAG